MKESFRQSMAWLHTWTGLVVGWVLFFIFVTGTASFANQEITRWMQPERPLKVADAADATSQFALAYRYLQENVASQQAESWTITFASDSRNSTALSAGWSEKPATGERRGKSQIVYLDSDSGVPLVPQEDARATAGGRALLHMHFALQYIPTNTAFIIVGICTMFMFVAIITGIVAHKKFFKDFFTFRHSKGLRSWLDAHNLVSVAALPFFVMITYSGLIFFIYTYMPLGVPLTYGAEDEQQLAYYEKLIEQTGSNRVLGFGPGGGQGLLTELKKNIEEKSQLMQQGGNDAVPYVPQDAVSEPVDKARGQGKNIMRRHIAQVNNALGKQAEQFTDLTAIVREIQQEWGANKIRSVTINGTNRNGPAKIQFSPAVIDSIMRGRNIGSIEFNAINGTRLIVDDTEIAVPEILVRAMLGLHEGLFAGPLVRWLYLISGFLGCAMIATGLILWTVKRRPKLQKTGEYAFVHSVVEKLNIATIAGLSFALAIYFWSNRLLPIDLEDRAQWEIHSLFISWILTLLYSVIRPVMPAWRELLAYTAGAWLLLPLLNLLTTDRHLLVTMKRGDWVLISIDLVFIGLGIMFGWASWKVHRKMLMTQNKAVDRKVVVVQQEELTEKKPKQFKPVNQDAELPG